MDRGLKAYLAQAVYDFCIQRRLDPFLVVIVGGSSNLPDKHSDAKTMTLNLGSNAIRDFRIEDGWIYFSARFSGVVHSVCVDIDEIVWMGVPGSDDAISFMPRSAAKKENTVSGSEATSEQPQRRDGSSTIENTKLKLL